MNYVAFHFMREGGRDEGGMEEGGEKGRKEGGEKGREGGRENSSLYVSSLVEFSR